MLRIPRLFFMVLFLGSATFLEVWGVKILVNSLLTGNATWLPWAFLWPALALVVIYLAGESWFSNPGTQGTTQKGKK